MSEIELVIKIPEEYYDEILAQGMHGSHLMPLYKALVSGTPLPQETGWIPVSERLPEAGEYAYNVAKYYLVQNEYGDMLVARYTHGKYWEQMYQHKPYADKIVAWMPLPKPYKAESEREE